LPPPPPAIEEPMSKIEATPETVKPLAKTQMETPALKRAEPAHHVQPAAPKPVVKPAERPSSTVGHAIVLPKEWERAWRYYQDAAERDISDHEKVEILNEILKQFGEQGAARVNKELERLRRRME
jgi:hypothetical protein